MCMDIEYKDVIDFTRCKKLLEERGVKVKFLAEKVGQTPTRMSQILKNNTFPKTDLIAKMCSVLKAAPSEIVEFKIDADEKKKKWFEDKPAPFFPPENPEGVVTYDPLWQLITLYLEYINVRKDREYNANDLFDKIEPYRRRNGLVTICDTEATKKSLIARGFPEDYKSPNERHYKAVGLIPKVRTKLKYDRPLNVRTIYDICNFFGCSIDWVMSYK